MKALRGLPFRVCLSASAEQASDFAVRGAAAFLGFLPSVGAVVVVVAGVVTLVVAEGVVVADVLGVVNGVFGFTTGAVRGGVVVVCANEVAAPMAISEAATSAVLKTFIGISVLGCELWRVLLDHCG